MFCPSILLLTATNLIKGSLPVTCVTAVTTLLPINLFNIHSIHIYCVYYMPDAVPGTKDAMANETEKVAVLMVLIF